MIPINLPEIGEEEIEAVIKVMRRGPLTNALGAGPAVTKFEQNMQIVFRVKRNLIKENILRGGRAHQFWAC